MFQEKKTTISLTKTKLLIEHEENINAWYYLSLLKNKNTVSRIILTIMKVLILQGVGISDDKRGV